MNNQQMKQMQLNAYGEVSGLQLLEVPVPVPGAGELLIRVEAAGVNFSDVLRRRNTYFMPTPLPYVLGAEAVGIVSARGSGDFPPGTEVGSRVLAMLPYGGAYSDYVTAPAHFCVPLPPSIDARAATALFVQGSTAYLLLHHVAPAVAGKSILIHAAAGGVGSLLVQLARRAGAARIIGTVGSLAKEQTVLDLGADAVVDYSRENWPLMVVEANGGQPVDLVLEMVGGEIFSRSFECLATGGSLVVYGAASGIPGQIASERLVDQAHQVRSFNLAHFLRFQMAEWQQALGALIGMLAEGSLRVETTAFPLDQAALAHAALESRQTTGKVVLLP